MKKAKDKLKAELAVLATLSSAQLKDRWAEVGPSISTNLSPALMRRLLAQWLQERQLGNLPAIVVRELERTGCSGTSTSPRQAVPLTPGARLVREWNGQTIAVEVRADGFWWKGQLWRSLTEIAGVVTGAHWSGPRFFGLNRRG